MEAKRWYRSKTVLFNVLAVLVLVANQFGFEQVQLDSSLEVGIIAVVNMILRFVTWKKVV